MDIFVTFSQVINLLQLNKKPISPFFMNISQIVS